MDKVLYDFITTHADSLYEELTAINRAQDKIVAVTQNGQWYTIFYERNGNEKEG